MSKETILKELKTQYPGIIKERNFSGCPLTNFLLHAINQTREDTLKEAYESLINNPLLFKNDNLYSSVENIKPVFQKLISK